MLADEETPPVPTLEEIEFQKLQAERYLREAALRQASTDEGLPRSPEAVIAHARVYADFVMKG